MTLIIDIWKELNKILQEVIKKPGTLYKVSVWVELSYLGEKPKITMAYRLAHRNVEIMSSRAVSMASHTTALSPLHQGILRAIS